MTKSNSRKTPSRNKPQANSENRSFFHRPVIWAVVVLSVIAVGLGSYWMSSGSSGLSRSQPFDLSKATYVGAKNCVSCHAKEAELYKGSHHDCAMAPATPDTVLADFSDVKIEHLGVTSRMYREGAKYMVETEGPDGKQTGFEVKYVFGLEPLQQYLVEIAGTDSQSKSSAPILNQASNVPLTTVSRLQVLRLSWDTINKKWFHLDPPDVADRLAVDDDLHWTGIGQRWNTMCAECHTTNYDKGFDVKTRQYHSTFTEVDVSCEACHGPGSEHIKLAKQWNPGWNRERGYGLANLKRSAEDQIQACAPCHSRRDVIAAGFRPGDNYYDFYSNQLLTEPVYYADGQILDEDFDHGSFIQSKMYHKGIRCTDCHDPHTARLKHDGNTVCTSCHQHPTAKYDSVAHHFHKPGTPGAQCVNCHMPATTYMAVDSRRDHSLRIPRPDLSLKIGTPNACTGCHLKSENVAEDKRKALVLYQDWMTAARQGDLEVKAELDRANKWCDEACDKWYKETRRRDEHFGLALHAAQQRTPDAIEQIRKLLKKNGPEAPAIARATALQLLSDLDPMIAGEEAARAIEDDAPLVRAAAAQAIVGHPMPTLAANRLGKALTDSRRVVRSQAARSLSQIPSNMWPQSARSNYATAMEETLDGLKANNDRAGAHLMLGTLAELNQQPSTAIEHYRNAIAAEPGVVGPRSNLATLLEGSMSSDPAGKNLSEKLKEEIQTLRREELALLERDAKLLPDNASILNRLGLSLVLNQRQEDAVAPLTRAAELQPDNFYFIQAITMLHVQLENWTKAREWGDHLLKLAPDSEETKQILQEIESKSKPKP